MSAVPGAGHSRRYHASCACSAKKDAMLPLAGLQCTHSLQACFYCLSWSHLGSARCLMPHKVASLAVGLPPDPSAFPLPPHTPDSFMFCLCPDIIDSPHNLLGSALSTWDNLPGAGRHAPACCSSQRSGRHCCRAAVQGRGHPCQNKTGNIRF